MNKNIRRQTKLQKIEKKNYLNANEKRTKENNEEMLLLLYTATLLQQM